jgi:hypothetical protein
MYHRDCTGQSGTPFKRISELVSIVLSFAEACTHFDRIGPAIQAKHESSDQRQSREDVYLCESHLRSSSRTTGGGRPELTMTAKVSSRGRTDYVRERGERCSPVPGETLKKDSYDSRMSGLVNSGYPRRKGA